MNPSDQHGYETSDAHIRPLVIFAIGLAILCYGSFKVSRWLEDDWNAEVDSRSERHAMDAFRAAPSAPVLQATTRAEYEAHAAEEDRELRQYDWIDREAGIVQIPVSRAMEVLAERGLPHREEVGE